MTIVLYFKYYKYSKNNLYIILGLLYSVTNIKGQAKGWYFDSKC